MSNYIEYNRSGCLLQGSISVLKAIKGVVPIIHSIAGCGVQEKYIANTTNKYNENYLIPSTNVIEKQIVFGGSARLREQIKNTVRIMEGDLYVVVSGCATEIVGDDIGAMTKEAFEQGYSVINISTPGFKGNSFQAYNRVVTGIIEGLTKTGNIEAEAEDELVNVFGIVPSFDPYWEGNLEELDLTLSKIGLRINNLFGQKSSVDNWKKISGAKVNIAFTKYGHEIVKYLRNKYGTPYLLFDHLPIGIDGITQLFDKLATVFISKKDIINDIKVKESERYLYYLSKLAPYYYKYHIQKKLVIVGVSPIAASIGRYLEHRYGQIVQSIIITDEIDDEAKKQLENNFINGTKIYYTEDGKEIEEIIEKDLPEIILGSQLEERIAKKFQIPILHISLPSERNIILNKNIIGISGILSFIEEFSNIAIEA